MTALFPTYTSLWQRAKRLLATDLTPLWQRLVDACERDSECYQRDLERNLHQRNHDTHRQRRHSNSKYQNHQQALKVQGVKFPL